MDTDIKEIIEESKINIYVQLEYIGTYTSKLVNSQEAVKNKNVLRTLTIILKHTFKAYISTQYLEGYLLGEETKINESDKRFSTNFRAYKNNEIRSILAFINDLDNFNAFKSPKNIEALNIIKDSAKCLKYRLNKLIEIEKRSGLNGSK